MNHSHPSSGSRPVSSPALSKLLGFIHPRAFQEWFVAAEQLGRETLCKLSVSAAPVVFFVTALRWQALACGVVSQSS